MFKNNKPERVCEFHTSGINLFCTDILIGPRVKTKTKKLSPVIDVIIVAGECKNEIVYVYKTYKTTM